MSATIRIIFLAAFLALTAIVVFLSWKKDEIPAVAGPIRPSLAGLTSVAANPPTVSGQDVSVPGAFSIAFERRLRQVALLFKDNNEDIPAIDSKTLEDLEKGLVAMGDKATFGMVRDMALAMRAGLRDEKSHEWTKQAIGKYLSDVDKDGRLSDVLDLVGKTCFKDREALGKLVEPVIVGLCSGYFGEKDAEKALCVFVSPESTKELCGRLVSGNEGPSAASGEVAARLCRRDETLREWMKTVEGNISRSSGESRARWCVAMGHAEMMKVTPPDPLRKVKWLVEAEKCGKATLKGLNSKAGGETPG